MGKWYFKWFKPSLKASEQKTWWKIAELCSSSWWDRMMCTSPRSPLQLSSYSSEGFSAIQIDLKIFLSVIKVSKNTIWKILWSSDCKNSSNEEPATNILPGKVLVFFLNIILMVRLILAVLYSNFRSWERIKSKNILHLAIQLTWILCHIFSKSKTPKS